MLYELTVKGLGIIEEIAWQPGPGLNVITGETGAGKSLVVDAVEALLSGHVQEEDIRHGASEARVEGIFHLAGENTAALRQMLAEKGLESDDDLIISCDFRRQGRVTPRVNRQAVSRSLLRDVGAGLVDIHGQSQHLSLLNREEHLDFLDACAHTRDLRREFAGLAAELRHTEKEIENLSRDEREIARQKELLGFQIEEITRAELREGEEEELEQEQTLLASAEKLKAASFEVYRAVYGDDSVSGASSAVDRVNEAIPLLRQAVATDPSLQARLDSLEGLAAGLEELARDVRDYGDNLSYDPQRLEEVQNRLELIRGLKRKYGDSVAEILRYLAGAEAELEGLTTSAERRQQLEASVAHLKSEMGELASELSERRREAADRLAESVKKELADLSMEKVDFAVAMTRHISPEGVPFPDGYTYRFDSTGADEVVFTASTNPGEPLKPLDRIASTGEISRFMLALKSALAGADTIPVLIFDEIDIGVGGRSGEVIGRKLKELSRHHQIVCVTHLPQIAAFADAHFSVSKRAAGGRTVSTITPLEGEARLNELALMIAGPRYSETALKAARELVEKAAS